MKRLITTMLLAVAMLFGAQASYATLVTIEFSPLSGAIDAPYTGHVEDGFTITPTGGDWFEAHVFGNPVPSIYAGPIGSPSPSSIDVTGGLFTFMSVDLSSNVVAFSRFHIEGFLSGASAFSMDGTIPDTSTFDTIGSRDAFVIDRLTIQMTPKEGTTSMNLDNIVLDTTGVTPVPEPTVLTLLGIGAAGLRLSRRRRA